MITGKEYAEKALYVYNLTPKAGYIWGQAGGEWTAAKQANLVNTYNSDPDKYADYKYGAMYGKKWIGHRVWDCSGLTSWCGKQLGLTFAHGSNSSYRNDCAYKGSKTQNMKLPVGAWVYTGTSSNRGHIGIVIDDEYVIEAEGTKAGVVKSKISLKKWTWWGLAKGIEFEFIPGGGEQAKPTVPAESENTGTSKPNNQIMYPTLRRGDKGDLVSQLQSLLSKDGSNLTIDGIFGSGTQSAVRAFQKRHGLVVDGIVGPKTWTELLKLI